MKMARMMFWFVIVVAVGVMSLAGAGGAWAAVANDSILSQHFKEADGTSGQNTNSGSGVKTGHIQDGAVTTGKIAAGAVVNSSIAAGAVTDAKIAGPISASKISSAGLNADTVDGMHASDLATAVHTHSQSQVTGLEAALAGKSDVMHNHDVLYQQKYGKVASVAQTGGDYADPVSAMNNLASWCGSPSASNPCLLKIMPGVYDIGVSSLSLQPYVDLEGAGENITKIIGHVDSGSIGVLVNASNTEIRFISVENYGGGMNAVALTNTGDNTIITSVKALAKGAVYNTAIYNNASTIMNNVRAVTASAAGSGGVTQNIGIRNVGTGKKVLSNVNISVSGADNNIGVYNFSTFNNDTIMKEMMVDVVGGGSATGISNYDSGARMSNVIVNSTAASSNTGVSAYSYQCSSCTSKLDRSSVTAATATIKNTSLYANYTSLFVADTMLDGGPISESGATHKCIGVYDGNYDPYTCQ